MASSRGSSPHLTPRESEVLAHVALGKTNAEIARDLMLAPNTVKTYLQSASAKLGARNRLQAVMTWHGGVGGQTAPWAEPQLTPAPSTVRGDT